MAAAWSALYLGRILAVAVPVLAVVVVLIRSWWHEYAADPPVPLSISAAAYRR